MNDNIAVSFENVSKEYRLGSIGGGTLRGDLQSVWARLRKKEDPNTKIGEEKKYYKKNERFNALTDISFDVKKGEALGIIGHNGAGKSTLLKLLSRVTMPTTGKITVRGRIASMLEVGTGFHPELSGRDNVYLNGAILGMTKAEVAKKFDEIVKFAEMEKFIDTPVKRYSSGMYVKLAFAVAAHLDSDIMVMDEVLAVGDMKFQQKCLGRMGDAANSEGRTVLYVSHNMNTIRQLCSRCVVLDQGRVIFDGDTEEAIRVYSGEKNISPCKIEVANIKRAPEFKNGILNMTAFEVTDRKESEFSVGEKIASLLTFTAQKDVKDVFLRIIIKTDDERPVTMINTETPFNASMNETNRISLKINTERLAPGKYSLSFVLYNVNSFGTDAYLDGLKDVYNFEIVHSKGFNKNMEWKSKYWGDVWSDNLEVKAVD